MLKISCPQCGSISETTEDSKNQMIICAQCGENIFVKQTLPNLFCCPGCNQPLPFPNGLIQTCSACGETVYAPTKTKPARIVKSTSDQIAYIGWGICIASVSMACMVGLITRDFYLIAYICLSCFGLAVFLAILEELILIRKNLQKKK
jgi:DNA-directed RNA polymerase subunit RPC12/RpoP